MDKVELAARGMGFKIRRTRPGRIELERGRIPHSPAAAKRLAGVLEDLFPGLEVVVNENTIYERCGWCDGRFPLSEMEPFNGSWICRACLEILKKARELQRSTEADDGC